MIEDIMTDAQARMGKSVEALEQEFAKIRTGRAQTGVLDHITVPYYGSDTPLNQVAKVSVEDSRTLSITPFEKNMIQTVEKAIMASDLGLTPTTAGVVIRLPIPTLTEERRRELTKMAKHESETARIAVRNIRRDANADLKELLKEKEISEDDERRGEEQIQKLTDRFVAEIDALLAEKEQDLMSI